MKKIVPFLGFILLIPSVFLNVYLFANLNKLGRYQVVKVIDGDTFEVQMKDKIERVRLIGADAPETTNPKVGVQCFGLQASQIAKDLLDNSKVILEGDDSQGNRDIYGRLLRYVYLENGEDLSKLMIAGGFAKEQTFIDPYKKQDEFRLAQEEARKNKRGLWGVCAN